MAWGALEGLDQEVVAHYLRRILEMERKTWGLLL
jgi:hypothetical protein